MLIRQKNIETLKNFSNHLVKYKFKSFLPNIIGIVDLPSTSPDFDLDSLKFELSLDGQGYEIKDVFNNVVPNEQTPYIFLIQGGEFFAKIYKQAKFPKEWLQLSTKTPSENEGIFFRLQTAKEKNFNEIVWTRESVVTFNFKLSNVTSLEKIPIIIEKNRTYLTSLVKNTKLETQLKETKYKLVSLGGRFVVKDFKLEPEIFSDYVTNNPSAQKYLFFDEYQKIKPFEINKKINTIHTKKYISVFFDLLETKGKLVAPNKKNIRRTYSVNGANPLTAVKLTITPDGPNTNVRILNVSSLKNITTISNYFVGLINALKYKRSDIINRYKNVGLILPAPQKKKKEEPKKIRRLDALKTIDPELFGSGYARKCQAPFQPLGIIGSDNVDRHLTEYNRYLENKKGPFKVRYSYGANAADKVTGDTWYVCVPPHDSSNPRIFPYLLEAKQGSDENGLLDLDSKRPFVPCCGGEDKKLKKWEEGKEEKKDDLVPLLTVVIQPDKILRENIKGKLPLALKEAWNDENDTYLRYGVKKNPKSFIGCLSLALGDDIGNIQTKLIDEINTCRTQETFGYSTSQLKNIILDTTKYIDPTLFLGIVQTTLNVQVFLYSVSKKYPKGDIARPRTAFAYLSPLGTYTRSVVIVIQQDIHTPQCELIIRKGTNQKMYIQDDPLSTICKAILLRSSQVVKVAEDESPNYSLPSAEPSLCSTDFRDPFNC